MARSGANYHAFNGSKLEYATTENGTYTQIYGLRTTPDIRRNAQSNRHHGSR